MTSVFERKGRGLLMSRSRKIFVGSSSEAELMANTVLGDQIKRAGMKLVKRRTIFRPNVYPLEVFEQDLPQQLIGAILVATPDVFGKRKGTELASPVTNVILEYGYLAARLGRSRVAICEFGDVALPSDLDGLTKIKGGLYDKRGQSPLPKHAKNQLRGWLETLPQLAEEISPIRQVHGYSAKWHVHTTFKRWRGRPVGDKEEVTFDGKAFLSIEADGSRGSGMQIGKLYVDLAGFAATFQVGNEISDVIFDNEKGNLEITVEVKQRRLMRRVEGTPPDDLGKDWLQQPEGAPSFQVTLNPVPGKSKYLHGEHIYKPGKGPHQEAEEDWDYLD
jgi:hypothetical protein